jgi:hypothetical protein
MKGRPSVRDDLKQSLGCNSRIMLTFLGQAPKSLVSLVSLQVGKGCLELKEESARQPLFQSTRPTHVSGVNCLSGLLSSDESASAALRPFE